MRIQVNHTGFELFVGCLRNLVKPRKHSAKAETLGKGFAKSRSRQSKLGKESDGKEMFIECFLSGSSSVSSALAKTKNRGNDNVFAECHDGETLGKHSYTVVVCRVSGQRHSSNYQCLPSVRLYNLGTIVHKIIMALGKGLTTVARGDHVALFSEYFLFAKCWHVVCRFQHSIKILFIECFYFATRYRSSLPSARINTLGKQLVVHTANNVFPVVNLVHPQPISYI